MWQARRSSAPEDRRESVCGLASSGSGRRVRHAPGLDTTPPDARSTTPPAGAKSRPPRAWCTSASLRSRRVYSAVNDRPCGFAATRTSSGFTAISTRASMEVSLPALYSNFGGRDCLTHPGTEGQASGSTTSVATRLAVRSNETVGGLPSRPHPSPGPEPVDRRTAVTMRGTGNEGLCQGSRCPRRTRSPAIPPSAMTTWSCRTIAASWPDRGGGGRAEARLVQRHFSWP